jgi:hypothetical protein|nr:MAG TPA: hypothetical protein [Caudoviricetes sp.]
MKIKDLIERLKEEDGDDEVVIGLADGTIVYPSDVTSDSINVVIEVE